MQRPDVYVVSANVVNQPLMSWLHWNMEAVRPYLPDTSEYAAPEGPVDWRASKLPTWDGPSDINASTWESPEGKKHRWLPVRGKKHHVLELTPIVDTEYDAFGTGLGHWQIAAQEHYSFLETLEERDFWRYKYNIWDFQRKRMGIQFIAMMGADINLAKPMGQDDEHWFTVEMPNRLGRSKSAPFAEGLLTTGPVADGRGLVAHYSFGSQRTLGTTDILDRYRSYAKENVCTGEMLWSP